MSGYQAGLVVATQVVCWPWGCSHQLDSEINRDRRYRTHPKAGTTQKVLWFTIQIVNHKIILWFTIQIVNHKIDFVIYNLNCKSQNNFVIYNLNCKSQNFLCRTGFGMSSIPSVPVDFAVKLVATSSWSAHYLCGYNQACLVSRHQTPSWSTDLVSSRGFQVSLN